MQTRGLNCVEKAFAGAFALTPCKSVVAFCAEALFLAPLAVINTARLAGITVPEFAVTTGVAIFSRWIIWTGVAIALPPTAIEDEITRVAGTTRFVGRTFGAAALAGLAAISDPAVACRALHGCSTPEFVVLFVIFLSLIHI